MLIACCCLQYEKAKLRSVRLSVLVFTERRDSACVSGFNCHNVKKSNGDKRTCIQCGYYPNDRKENDEVTPWMEAFVNARKWIEATK